jgi:hypothetical protein
VTYKQILDMTGIPRYEIANHLLSLCHPKVNIMLKRPNTKKLEDNHQFQLNAAYKNQLKKVNIPLLRAIETEGKSKTTKLFKHTMILLRLPLFSLTFRKFIVSSY